MEIKELQKQVHENAKEHGWWDGEERNFGELIALSKLMSSFSLYISLKYAIKSFISFLL